MHLTEKDALHAFAQMINSGNLNDFIPILHDGFQYNSQTVLSSLNTKSEFIAYMASKLTTLSGQPHRTVAEMAYLPTMNNRACLVMFQGDPLGPVCTVLAIVRDGKLAQIDLCLVPSWQSAVRTGERPA
jgi:hypothetical protein